MTDLIILLVLGVVALFLARAFLVGMVYASSVIPPAIAVKAVMLLGVVLVIRLLLAMGE